MASASIGQVHKAILQSGKEVAVKFQRPGIRETFTNDLDTLQEIADWAVKHSDVAKKYDVGEVVDELKYMLLQELDYTIEASNLETLKENVKEFKNITVPAPILDYSSEKVLTMDYVHGKKVTDVTPLKLIETEMDPLVDDLVESYLKQVIVDGFAHADPHPGNVFYTLNDKIALVDLGMVAKFPKKIQKHILSLMMALSNYDGEKIAQEILKMSKYDRQVADIDEFKKQIIRLVLSTKNKTADEMETGRLIIQMNRVAAQNDIQIPVEINMLGKILLNMDQIVAVLQPDYQLNEAIHNYLKELVKYKLKGEMRPENIYTVLQDSKELAEKSPERINQILDNLAKNKFQLNVDAINESRFTDAFQKVANRITLGIIIAAMIIGASLLIQIPTEWKIFGYPGLAIILFLVAAVLGFYLVYTIIVKDDNFDLKK